MLVVVCLEAYTLAEYQSTKRFSLEDGFEKVDKEGGQVELGISIGFCIGQVDGVGWYQY